LVLIGGYFLFATLEPEEEAVAEEAYCQACLFQGQDFDQYQGKLPMLATILTILYPACFTSEVLQKLGQTKLFLIWILLLVLLLLLLLPLVTTWCYQALSHHMIIFYHHKLIIFKSLSGHPKHGFFKEQRLYGKPRERWDLVHGRMVKKMFQEMFFENDT
jgi:hypothetical protein